MQLFTTLVDCLFFFLLDKDEGKELASGGDGIAARLAFVFFLFLAAFIHAPLPWSLAVYYKYIISAFRVLGSSTATVLLPLSHPPVSPGLRSRVLLFFLISGE